MIDYIDGVFGPQGVLAAHFAGYSPRPGQIAFSRAVDRAISTGEHLVAEAGTGVGKSLGYAVPASYHAAHSGNRVVIVTANIALQEQIVRKDLPFLTSILPWKFTYALLKGRQNYACVERMENGVREQIDPRDMEQARDIVAWGKKTKTGDKSELSIEPNARLWSRFSVGSDECLGKECEFVDQCFANAANAHAQGANVIVTNYHLLFADMQIRDMTDDHAFVLPPYDVAILDEGHKAVDIARDFFGGRVTEGSLRRAFGLLPEHKRAFAENHVRKFFDDLRALRNSPKYKARLRSPDAVPWDELVQQLDKTASIYCAMAEKHTDDEAETGDIHERRKLRKTARRLKLRARRARELGGQIEEAMLLKTSIDPLQLKVHFLEDDGDRVALCSKPVHVADRLREDLFGATLSTTVTSATLTSRGSFDFAIRDLGVQKPTTMIAESPFRWGSQVLLVIPSGLPDPTAKRAEHTKLVIETCAKVIEEAEGRTLGLFTSRRAVEDAYERAVKTNYRILKQGDMPRMKLIDEFRKDVRSVLLGTESFWAGVDVPGESLSCVFIDRLPFTPPDDPIMSALQEQDPECFMKYSVPRAIIAFKQGFGRLIRATTDRGAVVVMDGRISTKFYGRFFLESLPMTLRSTNIGDVGRFLRNEPLQNLPAISSSDTSRSLFDR